MSIEVGKTFWLGNGWAAKVLRYAPEESPNFPYQVRALLNWGGTWWVDSTGEPNNSKSPKMITHRSAW